MGIADIVAAICISISTLIVVILSISMIIDIIKTNKRMKRLDNMLKEDISNSLAITEILNMQNERKIRRKNKWHIITMVMMI